MEYRVRERTMLDVANKIEFYAAFHHVLKPCMTLKTRRIIAVELEQLTATIANEQVINNSLYHWK